MKKVKKGDDCSAMRPFPARAYFGDDHERDVPPW